MSPDDKIIMAQINPLMGDLSGNVALIAKACKEYKDATLIVFPELCICGYPPEDLVMKPSFVESCMEAVEELAKLTRKMNCAILVGSPWRENPEDELPYNAAILLHEGQIIAIRYKHNLPNYTVFDEKRTFLSGSLPDPVEFSGHSYGIMICEDMWNNRVAQHLKSKGADIFIVPNGSPYELGKHARRLELAKERVTSAGIPLVYVNQVGGQDELVFDGGSFALEADGNVKIQLPFFEEAVHPARHASTYTYQENELVYKALVTGFGDYIRKNGASGAIIGLSGGIDSALAAVIAVDALGAKNVHCVMLPSPFTSQASLDDAALMAKNLGVRLDTINIIEPLQAFEKIMPGLKGLAHENLQSRIRGNILMAMSNAGGKMLVTTGNKSEMAVGYATIYGDMNGAFNPLKDLYKTKVYKLCRWKNEQEGRDIIPESILQKAPSAELRDNQKDQDSLPPYDILDSILEFMIEGEKSVEEICAHDFERATVLKIWDLVQRSEFKRYQAPPGTKITTKAFGRDRRYPMTNKYSENAE